MYPSRAPARIAATTGALLRPDKPDKSPLQIGNPGLRRSYRAFLGCVGITAPRHAWTTGSANRWPLDVALAGDSPPGSDALAAFDGQRRCWPTVRARAIDAGAPARSSNDSGSRRKPQDRYGPGAFFRSRVRCKASERLTTRRVQWVP